MFWTGKAITFLRIRARKIQDMLGIPLDEISSNPGFFFWGRYTLAAPTSKRSHVKQNFLKLQNATVAGLVSREGRGNFWRRILWIKMPAG